MASMGAGVSLAEAYVMRKLHKEKMERMMKTEAAQKGAVAAVDHHDEQQQHQQPNGCFFGVFKKSSATSAKVSSLDNA